MDKKDYRQLKLKAAQCRKTILRMMEAGGSGHIGGSFSCMDVVAVLYFHTMHHDPKNPKMADRDRFLISAGHKCLSLYSALYESGYFEEDVLDTYGSFHTRLPGHPNMYYLPGVEANTGALGHGLAIACGMAMGVKLDHYDSKVYAVMGDGELAEGSNWEAAAAAVHYKLDNLVAIVDDNELQINGRCDDMMSFEPIAEHFRGFGWAVRDIDGHDIPQIVRTLDEMPLEEGKPSLVVAHTIKGKGYSKAEGVFKYHYSALSPEEMALAKEEINLTIKRLQEDEL